jgi:hypothetical protein
MKSTAIFDIKLTPRSGITADDHFQLPMQEMEFDGHAVRLFPNFEVEEYRDPYGDLIESERFLQSFRIEIDHDGSIDDTNDQEIWHVARKLLRPLFFALKRESHNPDVDVRLDTLKWVASRDEDGVEKKRIWLDFRMPDFWHNDFDGGMWQTVRADIGTAGPSLETMWLLDALSFHSRRDFDLAFTAAAIALESSARRLLMQKFVDDFGLTEKQAEARVRAMNVPGVGLCLMGMKIIDPNDLKDPIEVSELRNKIVHGHHREITRKDSQLAILTAISMQNRLAAITGEVAFPQPDATVAD